MPGKPSVLSREERDLLIRLDTKMSAVEATLKDMNGNYTGRLLNLESNAVSKIQHENLEERVRSTEDSILANASSLKTWAVIGGIAFTVMQVILSASIDVYVK